MEKLNIANNQAAFEYVLYMIASSYFAKATCTTGFTERNLLLHYKEQKMKAQYEMEEYCIGFMDKFEKRLGRDFFGGDAAVRLVREKEDRPVSIIFTREDKELSLVPSFRGRHSVIRYSVKGAAR